MSHNIFENVVVKRVFGNYNPDLWDMGAEQTSDLRGYGNDYITDKSMNNVWVGANGRATSGGIRVISGVFQIYLNGAWVDVVTNFTMREDATYGYTLEHKPIGYTQWIEVMTGQSLNNLGLNGYPITNAYKTSMGAYPFIPQIGGRTI